MKFSKYRICFVSFLLIAALSFCIFVFSSCSDEEKNPSVNETSTAEQSMAEETEQKESTDTKAEESTTVPVDETVTEEIKFVSRPRPDLEELTEMSDGIVIEEICLIEQSIASFDSLDTGSLHSANWSTPYGGQMSVKEDDTGNRYLNFTGINQTWVSPAYNIFPAINVAGTYTITLKYMAQGNVAPGASPFHICVRGTEPNSFMSDKGGNVFVNVVDCPTGCEAEKWYSASFTITVSESDLSKSDTWNLCFHEIHSSVSAINIDDVNITHFRFSEPEPSFPSTTQTWLATEFILKSVVTRNNPLYEAELDLLLTCGDTTLKVPGFWDGGNTWRFRFALPYEGEWTWKTICSDTSDTGLHDLSGSISCSAYNGKLDIYKHGFVSIRDGERYFSYADGTPFFYLGDTHWTLFTEEYDVPGDHAGSTDAKSHFKYIIDKRAEQGFTVIQSEPIGSGINVTDGITEADITHFKKMDKYFAYIAGRGLVHANSQFFYPADMETWCKAPDFEKELRIAARYWVARYSAYPVLWTLGQEVDKDFYSHFDTASNPYFRLCELMDEYDYLNHPITAHQESTYFTQASDSSFRNIQGHSWYGAQWSPELKSQVNFVTPKDYWKNGQNKPVILYESLYDYLWTNHFGARAQGWLGFTNGMYGYGYGAIDIWYYKSSYDMDTDSNQHGILITSEDKQAHWSESVNYESAWQVGYMSDFFYNLEWWKLTPRFNDSDWFRPRGNCFYSIATDDNDTYVLYFYSSVSNTTGKVKGLDIDSEYTMWWFNPRTGDWSEPDNISSSDGTFDVPAKPDNEDWVMLIKKSK